MEGKVFTVPSTMSLRLANHCRKMVEQSHHFIFIGEGVFKKFWSLARVASSYNLWISIVISTDKMVFRYRLVLKHLSFCKHINSLQSVNAIVKKFHPVWNVFCKIKTKLGMGILSELVARSIMYARVWTIWETVNSVVFANILLYYIWTPR